MKKFDVVKIISEYKLGEFQYESGMTYNDDDIDSHKLAQFDTKEKAVEYISTHGLASSYTEYVSNGVATVTEYAVECNHYDDDGEFIEGCDIVYVAPLANE